MKQNAPRERQRQRRPDQPAGPDARFHQLLGGELLDRRQDVAAGPVGPRRRASRRAAMRWKSLELLGAVRRATARRRCAATGSRTRALLERPPEQGRLQVPVAEHRRGRAEQSAHRPAPPRPSATRRRSARTPRALRRRERSRRPARPPRRAAATRSAGGAMPSPISRISEPASNRLTASSTSLTGKTAMPSSRSRSNASCSACGHALDHDDDRRRAGGRGAAHLIFEQRPAGERKQGAKAAANRLPDRLRSARRAPLRLPSPRSAPRASL